MNISHFLEGWNLDPKLACLSKDIHGLDPSPALATMLFHIGMLARDLSRERGHWPKRIVLFGDLQEGKDLIERFKTRDIDLIVTPSRSESKSSETPLPLEVGLEFSSKILDTERGKFLSLNFTGLYPTGSQGDAHGKFIYRLICLYAELSAPDAILVDLRRLEYTWGDGLEIFPPAFVSLDSRIGIVIEARQAEHYSYIVSKERMFYSEAEAIASI